jgi:hypothetical protein
MAPGPRGALGLCCASRPRRHPGSGPLSSNVRRRRWHAALSSALRRLRGLPMPALAAPRLRSPSVRRHRQAAPVVPRGEFTPRLGRAQPLFAGCTGPSVCRRSAAGRAAPAATECRAFPSPPLARAPGVHATRLMLGQAHGQFRLCRCSPPRLTGRSRRTSAGMAPGPRAAHGLCCISRPRRHPGSGPLSSNVRALSPTGRFTSGVFK